LAFIIESGELTLFASQRALREHMEECLRARQGVNQRIEKLNEDMESGFSEARRKIDERHEQNQASIGKIYSGLWKVVLWVLGLFVANYLAQHGLTAPGFGH
jgi:hypothetical protein